MSQKRYEELTEQFMSDLDAVGGPFAEFVEGLEHAVSELKMRLAGAREELRNMEKADEDA